MTIQAVHNVLSRGVTRGQSVWPAFQYQATGMLAVHVSERAIIFGIYSGAYLHGYHYLQEITYEALAQAVLTFDQAMAELNAEEQRAVIDIAAKNYIEDQTLAAKDAALVNKQYKVTQKIAEVDAKLAALDADREALATKLIDLDVKRAKIATSIVELEGRIAEQEYDSAQVDAEIARQELLARKADLDVVETGIRALEIQAQVADAAYRLAAVDARVAELDADIGRIELETVEVDVRIAQTEADTSRLTVDAAKESLTASELAVEKARTAAMQAETGLQGGKEDIIDEKISAAVSELNILIPQLETVIDKEKEADLASQEAQNQHKVQEYENRTGSHNTKASTSTKITELENTNSIAEGAMIKANQDQRNNYDAARTSANRKKNDGAKEAAKILAGADIVNTLTHQIGAAK